MHPFSELPELNDPNPDGHPLDQPLPGRPVRIVARNFEREVFVRYTQQGSPFSPRTPWTAADLVARRQPLPDPGAPAA